MMEFYLRFKDMDQCCRIVLLLFLTLNVMTSLKLCYTRQLRE